MANTDENTGVGTSMDAGMTRLIEFNSTEGHKLYKKLNLNKVGLAGHSQGATCTINLASKGKYANCKYYKTVFACSLPTPQLAASPLQNCPYDASLVTVPTLLLSGTGSTDANFICPLETSTLPAISKIKNDVYAARMKGVEHSDSIMKTLPYMMAWFEYRLCGNKTASKAFIGKSPELKTNTDFQDYKRRIYCKKTSLTEVKAGKQSFKATWQTVTAVAGYQLEYSTGKKFPEKLTKSVLVSGKTTSAKTVKKLKSKKVYYVRIRTYRTVAGIKYYGKWSNVLTVKTK